MLSGFTCGTFLLPNDDELPTADASTERFKENLVPNGAFLPNSAHMSVNFPYKFLVLTLFYSYVGGLRPRVTRYSSISRK
jgi:hypothetical protein